MLLLLGLALAADADGDGWHTPDDCNDADASIHPGANELCEGSLPQIDQDCDGDVNTQTDPTSGAQSWASGVDDAYIDADLDYFGDANAQKVERCLPQTGWDSAPVDCDDSNPQTYPGQHELCNGIDDDCDGAIDNDDATDIDPDQSGCVSLCRDADLDQHGDPDEPECLCPEEPDPNDATGQSYVNAGISYVPFRNYYYIDVCDDCYDLSNNIYPGAPERHTGRDDDCDGRVAWTEADCDNDQWRLDEPTTACAADQDVACWSGTVPATCDATTGWLMVDLGGRIDSFKDATDCDDQDPSINPDQTDIPDDGIDQDCDGADAQTVIDTAVLDSPGGGDSGTDGDKDSGCNCGTPGTAPWLAGALFLLFRRRA